MDLDFTLMEMNPFTLDAEGKPFPLDMRGELDDTAAFKSGKKCAACPLLHMSMPSWQLHFGSLHAYQHSNRGGPVPLTGSAQA